MSRFDIGRKSCACAVSERDRAAHLARASSSAMTTAAAPVRDERAVGALQRSGDERVFVRFARQKAKPRSLRICA
jgi:hypothetical protein